MAISTACQWQTLALPTILVLLESHRHPIPVPPEWPALHAQIAALGLPTGTLRRAATWVDERDDSTEEVIHRLIATQIGLDAPQNRSEVRSRAASAAAIVVEAAHCFDAFRPGWQDELRLRINPLKQMWQARGPGFLTQLARRLNCEISSQGRPVRILAVLPNGGGDGVSNGPECSLWIAAMLTDQDPTLPEITRLAFLMTQVMSHRVRASFSSDEPPLLAAARLCISVASELDWQADDELTWQTARQLWNLDSQTEFDSPNARDFNAKGHLS